MKIRFWILLLAGSVVAGALPAQVALRNSGLMHVGGDAATATALYIGGDFAAADSSDIRHPGKTVLAGNFVNKAAFAVVGNVYSHVFQSDGLADGVFEFRGASAQTISATATASKKENYILFPHTVIINNDKESLLMASTVAANMKNITFTKGRLILDSDTTVLNESRLAHLFLEEGAADIANTAAKANIQVNLRLGDREGRLVGFTPPFEKMYADYFFFNFLSIPSETELFKGNGRELWNTDPKRALTAGTGYILGQVLVPYSNTGYYTGKLDAQWAGALLTDMTRDKFAFNRNTLKASKSFGAFVTATDAYTGEKLINADVALTLQNGYNYLGNPFMVPLDLSALLTDSRTDWGITGAGVAQNYYVLSKGATGYSASGTTFAFKATYLVGQSVGATTDPIDGVYGKNNLIAPLQLFVLKNDGAPVTTFKIPRAKRTHGAVSFLRSATTEETGEPVDELLIETRSLADTTAFDRLCVVFRSEATLDATDPYDAEKLFNRTGGINQIYTRSADGKQLTTNLINPQTQKLTLYYEPALEPEEIQLIAGRTSSLKSVRQVILEDTKTGQMSDLLADTTYTFLASPADNPARFVLHFSQTAVSVEEIRASSTLTAYYKNGVTSVYGLTDSDLGGYLSLYNMQGQRLLIEQVTGDKPQKINRRLNTGIYLIRSSSGKTVKLMING